MTHKNRKAYRKKSKYKRLIQSIKNIHHQSISNTSLESKKKKKKKKRDNHMESLSYSLNDEPNVFELSAT